MKKGDFIIIATVALAAILSVVLLFSFSKQGSRVIIKQNNEVVYDESIDKNVNFNTGTNVVVVKDGTVFVSEANCKNQVCVASGKISKKGESIICLPNKVTVEIK